jgi:hypothetical protein
MFGDPAKMPSGGPDREPKQASQGQIRGVVLDVLLFQAWLTGIG